MAESRPRSQLVTRQQMREEIVRLRKVVKALADRAERNLQADGSEFSVFQASLLLESQVHKRTAELEAAFRQIQRVNRSLREYESRFLALTNQNLVGISLYEDGLCRYVNPKAAAMFGYTVSEILGRPLRDFVPPLEYDSLCEKIQRRFHGTAALTPFQFTGLRKDGLTIEIESHAQAMQMDGKPVLLSMMIDITERMREQREIEALQARILEQAIHDPLTGLYNRMQLNEFFDRELRVAERQRRFVSILMADIDHFKQINDTWGHPAGDSVLAEFAALLRTNCRASDICCRYGGEEFLVLLPDLTQDAALSRTEFLRTLLEHTAIQAEGQALQVTASFGVAVFPLHGQDRKQLIAAADRALYRAKHNGRNRVELASPITVSLFP